MNSLFYKNYESICASSQVWAKRGKIEGIVVSPECLTKESTFFICALRHGVHINPGLYYLLSFTT